MAISVTPSAHDITFNFKDSCNSRCCRPTPTPTVYVNSEGEVESYKRRKARLNTQRALERSISHLHITLERKVCSFNGNPAEFQDRIGAILDSIAQTEHMTLSHIEAINGIMVEYLIEKSPDISKPVEGIEVDKASLDFEEATVVEAPKEEEKHPSSICRLM